MATTYSWKSAASGTWSTASNWSKVAGTGTTYPGTGDTAIIAQTGANYTVTIQPSIGTGNLLVGTVQVNSANADVVFGSSDGLSASALVAISAGTIDVGSTPGKLILGSSGTLAVGYSVTSGAVGTATGTGSLLASAGTVTVGNTSANAVLFDATETFSGGILTDSGGLQIAGGTFSQSAGSVTVAGITNITGGTDTISGGTFTTGTLAVGGTSNTLRLLGGTLTTTVNSSSANTISSGDTIAISGGAVLDFTNNGTNATAGVADSGTIRGAGTIKGVISGSGTIRASGGVLDLTSNISSTTLVLNVDTTAGSVLELDGSVISGETIALTGTATSGSAPALQLTNLGGFSGTVAGLAVESGGATTVANANYINIGSSTTITKVTVGDGTTGNQFTGTNASATTLNLYNGATKVGTISLGSAPTSGAYVDWGSASGITSSGLTSGTDIFLDSAVCFAVGTRILTATGEVAVEDLAEGDLVVTQDGEQRPIKWLGHRRIDLLRHPNPHAAAPVRIHRGAFGDNLPHRDLVVSPEHCLFVDGGLVPAKRLINDMTIVQERETRVVTYYHVELDRHAILFAEGVPAESYLDTGNRSFFSNAGLALVLHPEFTINAGLKCWETDACAPLTVAVDAVRPVWESLAQRAESLGYGRVTPELTDDPDLHVVADGRAIRPFSVAENRYAFALPAGVSSVRLVSRASVPSYFEPYLDDWRTLGVAIRRIVLRRGGEVAEIPTDHPGLQQGWHAVERNEATSWRWMNGNAVLPIQTDAPVVLEVHVAIAMRHAVEAPADERLAA